MPVIEIVRKAIEQQRDIDVFEGDIFVIEGSNIAMVVVNPNGPGYILVDIRDGNTWCAGEVFRELNTAGDYIDKLVSEEGIDPSDIVYHCGGDITLKVLL